MYKLIIGAVFLTTSIYSLNYSTIDGGSASFGSFHDKKILIVNIATGSPRVDQLAELQNIYDLYHDSLVIIAFPSNSFGHENRSNADIKSFCQDNYHTTFLLAGKGDVEGGTMQPVYQWLADAGENEAMNGIVVGDFQKFLVNKDGSLIGVYAPSVNPQDSTIINAITSSE